MKENPKAKKQYEAPQLTVVAFKTESGYAASLNYLTLGLWTSGLSSDVDGLQDYTVQSEDNWL